MFLISVVVHTEECLFEETVVASGCLSWLGHKHESRLLGGLVMGTCILQKEGATKKIFVECLLISR